MSKGYYNSEELIESVIHRANVPISQITITNEDILRFANEEISENLAAQILAVREEFYVTEEDFDSTEIEQLGDNSQRIEIPYRAFGSKIRLLQPLNGANAGVPLSPIPLEQVAIRTFGANFLYNNGFYIKNSFIYILDSSNSSYRASYYIRPSELVMLDRAAKVVSIDRDTGIIEVDSVPSNIEALSLIDFNQSLPNHRIYAFDKTVQTVNAVTNQMTFTPSDIPTDLVVGDYICTAGECVIPQIPSDLHSMLAQATACKVLEAQGDINNLKAAFAKLEKMEKSLLNMITNRIEAPGKKLVNLSGLLYKARGLRRKMW